MSRAYRISVSESIRRHIRVEDGIAAPLELLDILPREQMAELLAAELAGLGLERDGNVARRIDDDGLEIHVDLAEGRVTVKQAAEAEVELEEERAGHAGRPDDAQAKERLRKAVRRDLERKADARQEKLQRELTAKLEGKLRELQAELDGAVNRATGEALKRKAAQLGEIEEISEDAETGSMTIKVRV